MLAEPTAAYAYDLLHSFRFLAGEALSQQDFRPSHTLALLNTCARCRLAVASNGWD